MAEPFLAAQSRRTEPWTAKDFFVIEDEATPEKEPAQTEADRLLAMDTKWRIFHAKFQMMNQKPDTVN